MKLIVAGLLSASLLAAIGCGMWRRTRVWSQMKQSGTSLDGLARVNVPEDFRYDPEQVRRTDDASEFEFSRVNDTHINGTTSYAENLTIALIAPDLPEERFKQRFLPLLRTATPVSSSVDGSRSWEIYRVVYESHPVTEPSWRIRLSDYIAGYAIDWRGFEKQYTLEQAKANLDYLRSTLIFTTDRKGYFASKREWDTDGWEQAMERNLAALTAALAAAGLPPVKVGAWTRHGVWRYTVDNERPQQFHIARALGPLKLPDHPFRLLGPITAYKYWPNQSRWWQNSQVPGASELPPDAAAGLHEEMTDREQVYFYRIHSLNLWKAQDPGRSLAGFMKEAGEIERPFREGKLVE